MATRTKTRAGRRATSRIATTGAACCMGGVCDRQRVHKLLAPASVGTHPLVSVEGPGVFVAGHVTKARGATGLSFVRLVIDGRVIVDVTFAAARTFVFPIENPYGVLRFASSGIQHLGFGWPVPLVFKRTLNGDRERARSRPAPRGGHRRQHPLLTSTAWRGVPPLPSPRLTYPRVAIRHDLFSNNSANGIERRPAFDVPNQGLVHQRLVVSAEEEPAAFRQRWRCVENRPRTRCWAATPSVSAWGPRRRGGCRRRG